MIRIPSKFLYVPDNIRLANLGSSQEHCCLNYEDCNEYNCFNFALTWQHNKYNYYVFKQYADKFSTDAILLIPVSYFDITRIEKDVCENYYGVLSRENFPDWDIKEYLKRQVFPLFSTKEVWKKLFRTEEKNSLFIPPRLPIPEEDLKVQTEGTFFTWTAKTDAEQGEKGFNYNIEMVSNIIDLCHEKGIVPVLISSPQIYSLNDKFAETVFFDTFYRFTDILKKKYPDIIYLDYSHDNDYSLDTSLFCDVAHLNVYGAKKFTKQIVQDLKDVGLL